MPNFSPYSNYGYVALKQETTQGTAVTPDEYLRILSESIIPNYPVTAVNEISGDRERNIRTVKGQVEISGDIEFYVESKMIGHFLNALYGSPTTQTLTADEAYRHVFDVTDTPNTYTIDIKPADAPWVHRFYGVQITGLAFEGDDNKIKCTASTMPRKAFVNSRVLADVSSGTTLTLDQTSGLTTSDTIIVIDKDDGYTTIEELTITSVDSETQLTVSTISQTIEEDDLVVIKKSTESYVQDPVFTWLGGSTVYTGTSLGNLSEECKETFDLTYTNEVEQRWCSGLEETAYMPSDVLVKGYMGEGNVGKYYDKESNLDKLRQNESIGFRVLMQGETALEANSATNASSTFGSTANGFKVEATTAGKDGNDYNVSIVINTSDTLAATLTGKDLVIKLADTTASNNTGTLIAGAVTALSGLTGTAEGTGAEEFTAAEDNVFLGFAGTTDVVGRDASEKPYLQFDNAAAFLDSYFVNNTEDSIIQEDIPLKFFKDVESGNVSKKISSRIYLVNEIASY